VKSAGEGNPSKVEHTIEAGEREREDKGILQKIGEHLGQDKN
jgi:hypothetical protein